MVNIWYVYTLFFLQLIFPLSCDLQDCKTHEAHLVCVDGASPDSSLYRKVKAARGLVKTGVLCLSPALVMLSRSHTNLALSWLLLLTRCHHFRQLYLCNLPSGWWTSQKWWHCTASPTYAHSPNVAGGLENTAKWTENANWLHIVTGASIFL